MCPAQKNVEALPPHRRIIRLALTVPFSLPTRFISSNDEPQKNSTFKEGRVIRRRTERDKHIKDAGHTPPYDDENERLYSA